MSSTKAVAIAVLISVAVLTVIELVTGDLSFLAMLLITLPVNFLVIRLLLTPRN